MPEFGDAVQQELPGMAFSENHPIPQLAQPPRRTITIGTVLNGWVVTVGCQQVVFTDWMVLVAAMTEYMKNPAETEHRWLTRKLEV